MRSAALIAIGLHLLLQSACLPAEAFPDELAHLKAAFEEAPDNNELLRELALLCFSEAGEGENDDATPEALKYITLLTERFPENAYYKALLGSTITIQARPLIWPPKQLKIAAEGNSIMDEAVAAAPDDPLVRWIRAINNFHMPAVLGRRRMNREDFAWLWKNRSDTEEKLDPKIIQEIAICHGTYLAADHEDDEADRIWKTALELAPDSPLAPRLRKLLDE